jgi:predicted phage baseplate assembly protein
LHLATVTASQLFAASPGAEPDHLRVDFTPPLAPGVENAVLRGNIAKASHGETHPDEPLGNGDARRAFATYRLRRAPLTYLQTGLRVEGVAELELRVNGERWEEVPSLYGRAATDRVYTARQTDAGETEITFGDGRTGARVPTGAGNIVARYRTGSGLVGNVAAGQLAIPLERPVGLRTVTNPLAAGGGADPETRDDARMNAPTTVRTFGRAVSLDDFAWLATSSGLVARAHATWVWHRLEKAVHLTVAGPAGARLSADSLSTLYTALSSSRDPNRTLLVANLVRVPIVVAARVVRDPAFVADDVRAWAREALAAHFSFERMVLGGAVHASDVYAAIHRAKGVVAVDLDEFHLKGHAGLTAAERSVRAVTADPVQMHIRIFEARPTPVDPALIDRFARAGFDGPVPPVLAAEQAFIDDAVADVNLTLVEAL